MSMYLAEAEVPGSDRCLQTRVHASSKEEALELLAPHVARWAEEHPELLGPEGEVRVALGVALSVMGSAVNELGVFPVQVGAANAEAG